MDFDDRKAVEWQVDLVPSATRRALDYLVKQQWLKRSHWYLAGGTALALQMGHRQSLDLDFFTQQTNFYEEKIIAKFPQKVWVTTALREGTVYGELLGAKISFIAYPFFVPRQPYKWYGQIRVLSEKDISVMKIVAISQRGTKRDFVDLYWYCKNRESLEEVLSRLSDQYPQIAHNYHHILKSLTYFADAEADPMPKIFFRASWKEIKKFFQTEVVKVTRKLLGLK